ncbi:UDP-2,4-diacetamido-2,4,6-trideoxy-beta-L-altropyranose hydrolase [Halanaerocella petrolearia]
MIEIKKVAFRVDGGVKAGLGHIMRSLALARSFPREIELTFITKSGQKVKDLIKERGYDVLQLDSSLNYTVEVREVKELIKDNDFDILITDFYEIGQDYLLELKEVVDKLVSIHDFAPYVFPSDMVINGNVYAPDIDYQSYAGDTEFLLGTDYTLIREEFQNIPQREINQQVNKILVTVGGSDTLNLTPRILQALDRLNIDLQIDVVIGPGFENVEEIISITRQSDLEVALHFNVKRMSELMLNNDLAISAGGSTLYELAVTGLPAITLLQAENQILVAENMEEQGAVNNLGFGDQVTSKELSHKIKELIDNFSLRKEMSQQGQQLVDGQGAQRVVENLLYD